MKASRTYSSALGCKAVYIFGFRRQPFSIYYQGCFLEVVILSKKVYPEGMEKRAIHSNVIRTKSVSFTDRRPALRSVRAAANTFLPPFTAKRLLIFAFCIGYNFYCRLLIKCEGL